MGHTPEQFNTIFESFSTLLGLYLKNEKRLESDLKTAREELVALRDFIQNYNLKEEHHEKEGEEAK